MSLETEEKKFVCTEGVLVSSYDLGINFNGYPLEDIHSTLYDDILETIPQAGREIKNRTYKVLLIDTTEEKI